MKSKVECFNDHVVKHNTARFSKGLEWLTEVISINHKRELRVYTWYNESNPKYLLIPVAYELNKKFIKIEKLKELDKKNLQPEEIIENIKEFALLGDGKRINFYDFLSSPSQSVIRGLVGNVRFLGWQVVISAFKHIFLLYKNKPRKNTTYLIHKDLKKDQNMIITKKGAYFIDFGSSILTKHYFLTDIVELATDHSSYEVDFDLIKNFIQAMGRVNFRTQYLKSQIYLLLLRRYLHVHPIDRVNEEKMNKIKHFEGVRQFS